MSLFCLGVLTPLQLWTKQYGRYAHPSTEVEFKIVRSADSLKYILLYQKSTRFITIYTNTFNQLPHNREVISNLTHISIYFAIFFILEEMHFHYLSAKRTKIQNE